MGSIQDLPVADELVPIIVEWRDSPRLPHIQICSVLKGWRNTNQNPWDEVQLNQYGIDITEGDSSLVNHIVYGVEISEPCQIHFVVLMDLLELGLPTSL